METLLEKYCSSICCIDGIDTYIISSAQSAALMANKELSENLVHSWAKNMVMHFLQVTKEIDTLHLAFGHHKSRAGLSLEWQPILCYQTENTFSHVYYRDSWMCRECGNILRAPIIMPLCESEPDFYYETNNRFPAFSPLFQKYPCPKCGRLLQNHLIILR